MLRKRLLVDHHSHPDNPLRLQRLQLLRKQQLRLQQQLRMRQQRLRLRLQLTAKTLLRQKKRPTGRFFVQKVFCLSKNNLKVFGRAFFKKIGVISCRSHFAGIYGSARSCLRRNNRISRLARVEAQGIWVESEANDRCGVTALPSYHFSAPHCRLRNPITKQKSGREAKTVRWTVFVWETLLRGSPFAE